MSNLGGKYMAVKICPNCKSIIIGDRCTNKNCMSTVLDIDHLSLETDLKMQFKDIKSIKNIYASPYYNGQQALFDKNNIGDKYGFIAVDERWFKIAHERNMTIDVSFLTGKSTDEDGFGLTTIKEVSFSQVHKLTKSAMRYNILQVVRFGKGKTFKIVWGSNNGLKWYNISKSCNGIYERNKFVDVPDVLLDALSVLMDKWMKWSVSIISEIDGIEINYFIHKEQAYEIFKNREIKEGKKRRAALRHYVGEYSKEDGNLIEAYLRCDPKFEWNDMECEIIPPLSMQKHIKEGVKK